MLKYIHLFFVVVLGVSFVGRVMLAEFRPATLRQRWLKVMPHVLDTLLLISGMALIIQGNWLMRDYGWLAAKMLALIVFIVLGMLAMRRDGAARWLAFLTALLCLLYIAKVAVRKQILFWG